VRLDFFAMSIPHANVGAFHAASARGRGAARQQQCMNAACVANRAHKGTICAALFAHIRELEALRAQIGVRAAARGEDGSLAGQRAQVVEDAYDDRARNENQAILKGRLEALRALVREKNETGGHDADDPIVRALEEVLYLKRTQVEQADDADWERLWEEVAALEQDLCKKKKELNTMDCGICQEAFTSTVGGMAITGKMCFHAFHPMCIARQAMEKVKPTMRHDPNAYWRDATPDEEYPTYVLRDDVSHPTDDGDRVPAVFPSNVWVECPVCRNPNFANKGYYDQVMEALQQIDQTPATENAGDERDWVQRARDHHAFVLLAVPGENPGDLVMLVPAKEYGTGDVYEQFKNHQWNYANIQACGFTFSRDGSHTGGYRAWFRSRRPDDVLDPLDKFGGSLQITRRTAASTGPRSWRFDYGTGTYQRLFAERTAAHAAGTSAAGTSAAGNSAAGNSAAGNSAATPEASPATATAAPVADQAE
jgi:hypothetical protein